MSSIKYLLPIFTNDLIFTFLLNNFITITVMWCCKDPSYNCKEAYVASFGSKLLEVPGFANVLKKNSGNIPQPGYQQLGAVYSSFTAEFQNTENLVAIIEEQFLCHNSGQQASNGNIFYEEFSHQEDYGRDGISYRWEFTTTFPSPIKTGFYRSSTPPHSIVCQNTIKVTVKSLLSVCQ